MLAVSRRLASISDFGTNAAIHSGKAALAELTERRPGARRCSSDRKCSTSLVKLLTDFATNTDVKAFEATSRKTRTIVRSDRQTPAFSFPAGLPPLPIQHAHLAGETRTVGLF